MSVLYEKPETEEPSEAADPEIRTLFDSIKSREKYFADNWWKQAEAATELYHYEKEDPQNPYNILYSNTEVLKPSLYSATPKPDIRGRFVENPVSPLTKLCENFLIVFSDPADPGHESLDNSMSEVVASALVAGSGFIRLRHYPDRPVPICTEFGGYKDLIWARGKKWSRLPWIAFRHEMSKDEIFAQFKVKGDDAKKYKAEQADDSPDDDSKSAGKDQSIVYEVWVKEDREVYYLCEDWEGLLLREDKDPMKLQSFYPTPGPMILTQKPGRLIPTPLYQYYRKQAEELNRVTARLNKVLSAIKVKGAYNSMLGDELAKLLSDSDMDNSLVPAKEAGLLAQSGGFEKQIWLLPIDQLIKVASELYNARIQIKQVIYELTGLSDIIRGSSVASETATAQNLKNKWGSIRLRDMQKIVAGYVRDLYRLAVDASAQLVPAKTWKEITQLPFPLQAEKQAAVEQILMDKLQGRPSSPQVQQAAQAPSVEELLTRLVSDANRTYTINVQSDSTIDLDTATQKEEVLEFMNAMGQLMAGLQPLASLGPSGLEAAKAIVVAVCSRFKFGLSVVDSLKAIQQPPPQQTGPTPEQQQKEKDLQAQEKQLQTLLTKLEDTKRDLDTQQKEFSAEVKVFRAEQAAQEQISQAKASAEEASRRAAMAESKATFVERKSELTGVTAGLKASAKANSDVQKQATPVLDSMAKAIETMAVAVSELQTAVKALAKPRVVRKEGNSFISEASPD